MYFLWIFVSQFSLAAYLIVTSFVGFCKIFLVENSNCTDCRIPMDCIERNRSLNEPRTCLYILDKSFSVQRTKYASASERDLKALNTCR